MIGFLAGYVSTSGYRDGNLVIWRSENLTNRETDVVIRAVSDCKTLPLNLRGLISMSLKG